MASVRSEDGAGQPSVPSPKSAPIPVKIVIAGGFGAGKTTFVAAVSDIAPLSTEAALTASPCDAPNLTARASKTTTTVAMDFGRITLAGDIILYLFGTPGQARFEFMWDDLVRGAIGAVVLVDTDRLADSFGAVDYFEQRRLPFVVAVNTFDGVLRHELAEVRTALDLPAAVPVLACDARRRADARDALVELVRHALWQAGAMVPAGHAGDEPPAAATI